MRVDSTKFGNEAHFMSFAAIIATRNGTEGSNFHIIHCKADCFEHTNLIKLVVFIESFSLNISI